MGLNAQKLSFLSSSGTDTIKATLWTDTEKPPRAVLQIAHGMCEYIDRYSQFAAFLVQHGFAVCGNDHLGHGQTAPSPDKLGYFAPEGGSEFLVEDVHLLNKLLQERYPGLPLFLLGHSMGSFITRDYITRYGSGLAGYICSGTAGPNPLGAIAVRLADAEIKRIGPLGRSTFLDKLSFGSYNKRYTEKRTKYDWLSRDTAIVDSYGNDHWCSYVFTASGFRDLFTLLGRISQKSWAHKVPTALPILMISGTMDPVGDYAKGTRLVYTRLHDAGVRDLSLRLYDNCRHEVLNELNRLDVYADILSWTDRRIHSAVQAGTASSDD